MELEYEMNQEEQFALLIRLDERTKNIEEKVNAILAHADNGGWTRCHDREVRLKALEGNEETRRDTQKWFKRITISSLVGLTLAQAWKIFLG